VYDNNRGIGPDRTAPSFLKYQFHPRICKTHGLEIVFFRHADHVIPKLVVSATRSLTPELMRQRAICISYTAGTNPDVYNAAAHIYHSTNLWDVKTHDVITPDPDIERKISIYELTPEEMIEFPTYQKVMNRNGCPLPGLGALQKFAPWRMINETDKTSNFQ